MKIKITLVLFTLLSTMSQAHVEEKQGVVTASALKMRSTPDLNGEVILILTKATIVKILEESKEKTKVGHALDYWLRVEADAKTGWVFGGFVASYEVVHENPDLVTWLTDNTAKKRDADTARLITLYNLKTKKEYVVATSVETANYAFSKNLKYVAVDVGTDAIGMLFIYDVQNGKSLQKFQYSPRGFEWQGDQLKFNNILCTDDGYTIFEEITFSNGRIVKTGKYGKGAYHVGVTSGDCQKYDRLLKKGK